MKLHSNRMILFFCLAGLLAAQTYQIDLEKSHVTWTGRKLTGEHVGMVRVDSGAVEFQSGHLSGGVIRMDLTDIQVTDIQDPERRARLERHLKSEDFFSTENYPVAEFLIRNSMELAQDGKQVHLLVSGDLTIKGKSLPAQADVWLFQGKAAATATGSMQIDRTGYDIRYKSASFFPDLGDKAIDDLFKIQFDLIARPVREP